MVAVQVMFVPLQGFEDIDDRRKKKSVTLAMCMSSEVSFRHAYVGNVA